MGRPLRRAVLVIDRQALRLRLEPLPGAPPAWTRFNKRARKATGAVGIWHETFLVERAESIYVATKPMGLPKATELVEVGRRHDRAQARFADGRTRADAA
nr:DUF4188 domain-containing protein [Microbacterium sp. NIBRBAC000506063]